jgi:hypothetical protein
MKPLSELPAETLRKIRGVLFDIDDTLTTEGQLTARAYAAVEALKQSGLSVVPITGRPAGWCDHIARMWPVDGVVGENGAFYFYFDRAQKKLRQRFIKDDSTRVRDREQLAAVAQKILREVPGCAVASDQAYREADIAIDFCEDVPPLPVSEVERIKQLMEQAGLTAKISSIHVNGWMGNYDKLSTTRLFVRERFGIDLDAQKHEWIFVGDSPNDAPMFGFFPNSVGVANVRDFEGRMATMPGYVTVARCGEGFAEVAEAVLGGIGEKIDEPQFPILIEWLETGESESFDSLVEIEQNVEDIDSERSHVNVFDRRRRRVRLRIDTLATEIFELQ